MSKDVGDPIVGIDVPRRRGRPKGSKNKPKSDVLMGTEKLKALVAATPQNDLEVLADKINVCHQGVVSSFRNGLDYAIQAGELLKVAQQKVTHGQWLIWLEENTKVSPRVAQHYQRLAEHRAELESVNANSDSHLTITKALKFLAVPTPLQEKRREAKRYREEFALRLLDAARDRLNDDVVISANESPHQETLTPEQLEQRANRRYVGGVMVTPKATEQETISVTTAPPTHDTNEYAACLLRVQTAAQLAEDIKRLAGNFETTREIVLAVAAAAAEWASLQGQLEKSLGEGADEIAREYVGSA